MSASAFEAFLARLYVDESARAEFLTNPYAEAQRAGLDEEECEALVHIDRVGLELAAHSFARKRALHPHSPQAARPRKAWGLQWLQHVFSRFLQA